LNNLSEHIQVFPSSVHILLENICQDYTFQLRIKKERLTKLGDFIYPIGNEIPKISVNKDSNQYRVLITFLHELSHLIVFLEVGRSRNPHGPRWKKRFSQLLHIFQEQNTFPSPLKEAIDHHIIRPKASSYADVHLLNALRSFDSDISKIILLDLPFNQQFRLNNGKVFQKGALRRSRIICIEISSQRNYLIHSHAEVFPVE
jgi:SprT protein